MTDFTAKLDEATKGYAEWIREDVRRTAIAFADAALRGMPCAGMEAEQKECPQQETVTYWRGEGEPLKTVPMTPEHYCSRCRTLRELEEMRSHD